MGRRYCSTCHYPESVCLCADVKTVNTDITLILLLHPKEVNHAKNTGRLLSLAVTNTEIYVGETPSDFETLRQQVETSPENYCLVYPSDKSEAMESYSSQEVNRPQYWIFIDSTWRKAFKIYQTNPWLHSIKQWHFNNPPTGQYEIRKTSIDKGLSTLEAAAYCLSLVSSTDVSSLYQLFNAMQSKHFRP